MPQAKNKPWKGRWRELKPLGRGGQGTASLVEPLDAGVPTGRYVLKVLNSQNDADRRGRMYREVAALRTLDHPGVPRVIESNADLYADLQQHLYLVAEYIEGQTLEERIGRERLTVADASVLLLRLTEVVSYCHDRGVVHRDIKPDNVILRGDAVADPVLLDFGLSFNSEAAEESPLTASGQQLGNRFLALPELQLKSGNKRDPRSDLTQLCGLLLFAIAGEHPVTLLDDQSRLPHQRPVAAAALDSLSADTRSRLNRLFDVGFTVAIDRRFQSTAGLSEGLVGLIRPPDTARGGSVDERVARLLGQLANSPLAERQQYRSLLDSVNGTLMRAQDAVRKKLDGAVNTIQSGHELDLKRLTFRNRLGLFLVADEEVRFWPVFEAVITGSELVVTGRDDEREVELFRAPTAGPHGGMNSSPRLSVTSPMGWWESARAFDDGTRRRSVRSNCGGRLQRSQAIRLPGQRQRSHEWTEEDFGSLVSGYVADCPGIASEVRAALNRSYRAVAGEDMA